MTRLIGAWAGFHASLTFFLAHVKLVFDSNQIAECRGLRVGVLFRLLPCVDRNIRVIDGSSRDEVSWNVQQSSVNNVLAYPFFFLGNALLIEFVSLVGRDTAFRVSTKLELVSKGTSDRQPLLVIHESQGRRHRGIIMLRNRLNLQ